jgi:hypothetical protein
MDDSHFSPKEIKEGESGKIGGKVLSDPSCLLISIDRAKLIFSTRENEPRHVLNAH